MARAKVDFQVVNHGTIYLLYPNARSEAAVLKATKRDDRTRTLPAADHVPAAFFKTTIPQSSFP